MDSHFIEAVVMFGVIWNAVLQTVWYVKTLDEGENKHD
jgi:hypothetical protein